MPPPTQIPAAAPLAFADAHRQATRCVADIGHVLRGHEGEVRLVVAAALARGHVLLEDVPGVGKTTLARSVARVLGASFRRVQFTADMLPGDVLGVQVLAPGGGLTFRPGPIFADVVLADEINRASPKAQSAMLEAMQERAVTVDDATHPLPESFCVLATQNPQEHHGAYPLPESQLDRFMVRLGLGYPPAEEELDLLEAPLGPAQRLAATEPALGSGGFAALQRAVHLVAMHTDVARYALALVRATREHPQVALGVSPRGSLAMAALARAWALLAGREYVVPDDVKKLAPHVLAHRLGLRGQGSGEAATALIEQIVATVPAPR